MHFKPQFLSPLNNKLSPYIILCIGLLYLVYLISGIQTDVFFQGDGGMKYMVIKQIAEGQGFKILQLNQPEWVQQVWQQGFFPIKIPFLYPSNEGYIVSFSPGFQIISAFFYETFGYLGLYIIPVTSIIVLWVFIFWVLQKLHTKVVFQSIILLALIFASPLTVYGVTYWEHMPAVLLCFIGFVFLLFNFGNYQAFILGFLSGLSAWLRPEAMLLNLFFVLAAVILSIKANKKSVFVYVIGIAISITLFLLFNKYVYQSYLGVHGYQVLDQTLIQRIIRWGKNLLMINWLQVKFFPVVLFILPVLHLLIIKKKTLSLPIKLFLYLVIVFCLAAPWMLPNTGGGQWGPRYFLPLIPIILVLFTLIINYWRIEFFSNTFLFAFITVLLGYSIFFNTYKGGEKSLRQAYTSRIKPPLEYVRNNPDSVIVVNTEHIPMEMGAIFSSKYFFLVENAQDWLKLETLFRDHNITTYTSVAEGDIRSLRSQQQHFKEIKAFKSGSYNIVRFNKIDAQ